MNELIHRRLVQDQKMGCSEYLSSVQLWNTEA